MREIALPVLPDVGQRWLNRYQGQQPVYTCVLGYTATAQVEGISAAGATPRDRAFTAVADAEFLYDGPSPNPTYPLPPLIAGVSPALIARAVIAGQGLPVYLFDAGLPHRPSVPFIDLGGRPAESVSSGGSQTLLVVQQLFDQGLRWGQRLGQRFAGRYLIVSECVVAGTTTAQALLSGLGYAVDGKVNSSHPSCNHNQKQAIVSEGLRKWREQEAVSKFSPEILPLSLVAAVGDPMQIAAAGLALGASINAGVLLSGGSQMMAVYALIQSLQTHGQKIWGPQAQKRQLLHPPLSDTSTEQYTRWQLENIVVGTTRWVLEDTSSDTIGLAELIGVPLLNTQLSFADARFEQLRRFEQGYVKEGVGAGGCAIAAQLYQNWSTRHLMETIEHLLEQCLDNARHSS